MRTGKRGRPVEKPLLPPIPDSPENVALALLTTPPKADADWDYLNDKGDTPQAGRKPK